MGVTSPAHGQSTEPQFPVQTPLFLVLPQVNQQATAQIRTGTWPSKGQYLESQSKRIAGGFTSPMFIEVMALHLKGMQ